MLRPLLLRALPRLRPSPSSPLSSRFSSRFSSSSPNPTSAPSTPSPDNASRTNPDHMSPAESAIAEILSAALSPTRLLVQDISGGCGSMYAIDIASPRFKGQSMLGQQRMVNKALGERVREWHGVQIRTSVE